MAITTIPVLVLNQNYEPLNVCTARRAFVLVDRGKAEILENGRGYLHSPTTLYIIPSIIRLIYLIRRPRPQGRLTRRDVFLRDRFTCQYCGKHTKERCSSASSTNWAITSRFGRSSNRPKRIRLLRSGPTMSRRGE